jgi:hypothetical protein
MARIPNPAKGPDQIRSCFRIYSSSDPIFASLLVRKNTIICFCMCSLWLKRSFCWDISQMDICIYIHITAMKIFTMAPPRSSAAGGRKLFPKRLPLSTSRGTILPSQRFRLFPATIVHSDFSRKKSVSRDMLSAERGFSSHARAFSRLGVFHYQHQVFFSYLPMVPKSVYITVKF